MTRSAPPIRRAGNKLVWFLLTASFSLLSGLFLADHTAILTRLLGEPASASQISQRLEQHTQQPGHPVDHTMLEVVIQDTKEIKQDVKELLRLNKKGG